MSNTNDITGDKLISKPYSDLYRRNWDKIFARGINVTTRERKYGSKEDRVEEESKPKEEKKL